MSLTTAGRCCCSILATAFLATSQALSGELLINGGFEDGVNAWTFTGNGTTDTLSLSSDTSTAAGFSADLDINGPVGLPWLIQDVPVTPGMELTFTTSVKELEPSNPDAWIAGQVWMLPPSLASILSSTALFFTSPDWTTQTSTITVPVGATVARVLFTPQNPAFGVGTGRYLIDDVSLTFVPEPTSSVLLGGMGVALLARRRR